MISIKIPIRIVSEANSNEHWIKKAKRHKQQKLLIRAYMKQHTFSLPIRVKLTRHAPRPFDSDNLQSAFKYIRDAVAENLTGIKKAGMADSDLRIIWEYFQEKTTDKEYFVTLLFSQVDILDPSETLDSQSHSADLKPSL